MGQWEELKTVSPPKPVHVHEKPSNLRGAPPDAGSVWRCSCGRTWEVVIARDGVVPSYALHSWSYRGTKYYLSSFNYDQPSPFGRPSSC